MSQSRNVDLDHDQKYCPISHQIIRHPIKILPSNFYYELDMLHSLMKNNKLICPITRKPIYQVIYADEIKNKLDQLENQTDRYDEYNPENIFIELKKIIYLNRWKNYRSISHDIRDAVFGGLTFSLIMFLITNTSNLLGLSFGRINILLEENNLNNYLLKGMGMTLTLLLSNLLISHLTELNHTLRNQAGILSRREIILHELDQIRQRIPHEINQIKSSITSNYQQFSFFSKIKNIIQDKIEQVNESKKIKWL